MSTSERAPHACKLLRANERPATFELLRSSSSSVGVKGSTFFLREREKWKGGDPAARSRTATLLRLHPNHQSQFHCLREAISVAMGFRGVTGGVYKARERIHRCNC